VFTVSTNWQRRTRGLGDHRSRGERCAKDGASYELEDPLLIEISPDLHQSFPRHRDNRGLRFRDFLVNQEDGISKESRKSARRDVPRKKKIGLLKIMNSVPPVHSSQTKNMRRTASLPMTGAEQGISKYQPKKLKERWSLPLPGHSSNSSSNILRKRW
jgi:hypothetical protein